MTQAQLNIQRIRLSAAISKAYQAIERDRISIDDFNSRMSAAITMKRTLDYFQSQLNKALAQ